MSKIEIGKKAPAFTLDGTAGKWRLADAAGGPVLIYFYPRDNTPGCTQEGEAFAARYAEAYRIYRAAGAALAPISHQLATRSIS